MRQPMKIKMKSEYKNPIAKELHEKAWNDLGSSDMDFDSYRFAAALIEAGEYRGLYKIMNEMDTIPRIDIFNQLPFDKQFEFRKGK